jgi:SAM-dependent methyltransferase
MRKIIESLKTFRRAYLVFGSLRSTVTWYRLTGVQRYAHFQKHYYDTAAETANYEADIKEEGIVGAYEAQNEWPDYETYLMKYVDESYRDKYALDFGCGPGRNLIKYHSRFARLDGVDISSGNIAHARKNLAYHQVPLPRLYVNNGYDLAELADETYDFVFSTITLQHIPVHSTRYNLFAEFFRVLRPGGRLSVQMGYGADAPRAVDYDQDHFTALLTNRGCDTMITSPDQPRRDLEQIGFISFECWITRVGPGDCHPQWIFFTARRPPHQG